MLELMADALRLGARSPDDRVSRREWGVPVHDDRTLFEFLILEGAQAGLSWSTILNKREAYRAAFDGFDAAQVARYDERKTASAAGRSRHRAQSAEDRGGHRNARAFLAVQQEFGSLRRLHLAVRRRPAADQRTGARWRMSRPARRSPTP